MLYNELPTALPVYDRIEHQDRFREVVDETCTYQQINPRNALVPLQFTRPISGAQRPVLWKIHVLDADVEAFDLTPHIGLWRKAQRDGKDYFTYDGSAIPGLDLAPGWYYAYMSFADSTIPPCTEVFRIPAEGSFLVQNDNNTRFLKIEWWNDTDIRPILYNDKNQVTGKPYFRNVCYLDSYIIACEPETTITADPDGDGEQIMTEGKVVFIYRITDLVTDSLKKALALIPIHGHVLITTPGGVRTGEVKNVTVNTSLEADGARSNVEITFRDSYILEKGCDNNMQ